MAVVPTGGRSRDIVPYKPAELPTSPTSPVPAMMQEQAGGFVVGDVLADPQHVIEDSGWSGVTQNLYEYQLARDFPYQTYRLIVTRARNFWRTYPLAKRAIEHYCNYVLGEGVTLHCDQDDAQEWLEQFWNDQDNQRSFTGAIAQKRMLTFRQLDGELFVGLFPLPDGKVKVRRIESLEISEVVPDPENDERVLHYQRWRIPKRFVPSRDGQSPGSWEGLDPEVTYLPDINNTDLEGVPRLGTVAQTQVMRSQMRVYHSSILCLGKRGLSDLYAAFDAMEGQRTFIGDRLTLTHAWARLAWKKRIDAGPSVVARFASAERSAISNAAGSPFGGVSTAGPVVGWETNPPNQSGGTYLHNKAVDMEPVEVNTGAPNAEVDNRIVVTHIAAAVGIMLHYFGDAGDANLATATAQDHPMQKMFAMGQEETKMMWQTIINFVLCRGIEAGAVKGHIEPDESGAETAVLDGGAGDMLKQRKSKAMREAEPPKRVTVEIRFPKVVQRDTLPTTQAITAMHQEGGISRKDMALEFANLLGVLDVDGFVDAALADQEQQQEQEQQQTQMQQQHELTLTNARTQALTKPGAATSPPQRAGASGPTRSARMSEAAWRDFYTLFTEAGAAGGHWVTIENEEGETHIFISGGRITKGPHSLVGHNASVLSAHAESKGHKVTVHPEGHTPVGHSNHPHYHEHQDKIRVHGRWGDGTGREVDNPLPEKDDADIGKDYETANQGKRDARATPAPGATDSDTTPRHGLRRVAAALRHHADTHHEAGSAAHSHLHELAGRSERLANDNDGKEFARQSMRHVAPGELPKEIHRDGPGTLRVNVEGHNYNDRMRQAVGELQAHHIDKGSLTQGRIKRDNGDNTNLLRVSARHFPEMAAALHDFHVTPQALEQLAESVEAHGDFVPHHHTPDKEAVRRHMQANLGMGVKEAFGELSSTRAKHGEAHPSLEASAGDVDWLGERGRAQIAQHAQERAAKEHADKMALLESQARTLKKIGDEWHDPRASKGEFGMGGRQSDVDAALRSKMAEHYRHAGPEAHEAFAKAAGIESHTRYNERDAKRAIDDGMRRHGLARPIKPLGDVAGAWELGTKRPMDVVREMATEHRARIVKERNPKVRRGSKAWDEAMGDPRTIGEGYELAHGDYAERLQNVYSSLPESARDTIHAKRLVEDIELHRDAAMRQNAAQSSTQHTYKQDDRANARLGDAIRHNLKNLVSDYDEQSKPADIARVHKALDEAETPADMAAALGRHRQNWQDPHGHYTQDWQHITPIKNLLVQAAGMANLGRNDRDNVMYAAHALHSWTATHNGTYPEPGDKAAYRKMAHEAHERDLGRDLIPVQRMLTSDAILQRHVQRGLEDQIAGRDHDHIRAELGSEPVDARETAKPGTSDDIIARLNKTHQEWYEGAKEGTRAGLDEMPRHARSLVKAAGTRFFAHGNGSRNSGVQGASSGASGQYMPHDMLNEGVPNQVHIYAGGREHGRIVAAHEFWHAHDEALGRLRNTAQSDRYGYSAYRDTGTGTFGRWRSSEPDMQALYEKYRHDERVPEYMRSNPQEFYAEGMAWHGGHSNFDMPQAALHEIAPDLHEKFDQIHRESEALAHGKK